MDKKIGIIGLGYVGLPLAVEFGKKYTTVGFDINNQRISELSNYYDRTFEVESGELKEAKKLHYTADYKELKDCTVYIVTVPTPVDIYNRPDLSPLKRLVRWSGKF